MKYNHHMASVDPTLVNILVKEQEQNVEKLNYAQSTIPILYKIFYRKYSSKGTVCIVKITGFLSTAN
jgi:hypothetical protein